MDQVICPDCGAAMVLRETKKFHYRNGKPRLFYGCSRWPDCRAAHGAHPDGKPVGKPGTERDKKARMTAHAAFDQLWKSGSMHRSQAYKWLAEQLGVEKKDCHIGKFDAAMCARVVEACNRRSQPSAE